MFKNRKASFNYYFVSEYEAGIVLKGTEIKSIRQGKINFKDCYGRIEEGEIWLYNLHISVYEQGSYYNHDPERIRKLLLNRNEIKKIVKQIEEKGMTLVPKSLFINEKGLVKVMIAVAKGKKVFDKRETIRKKDEKREQDRNRKLN